MLIRLAGFVLLQLGLSWVVGGRLRQARRRLEKQTEEGQP